MITPGDYLQYVYLEFLKSGSFDKALVKPDGRWSKLDEMRAQFHSAVGQSFSSYTFGVPPLQTINVDEIFNAMMDGGVIQIRDVPFAGTFARTTVNEKDGFIDALLESSPISTLVSELGPSIIDDALSNISQIENWGVDIKDYEIGFHSSLMAPGSDRLVTLKDNQITDLIEKTDDVINVLVRENSIDGEPSLRERILGQLRAGKELILAGVFRLELIRLSLLDALIFIAKRYEKEAVGAAASLLLAELAKLII